MHVYKATPKEAVGSKGKAAVSRYFARAASEAVGRAKRYFMEQVRAGRQRRVCTSRAGSCCCFCRCCCGLFLSWLSGRSADVCSPLKSSESVFGGFFLQLSFSRQWGGAHV